MEEENVCYLFWKFPTMRTFLVLVSFLAWLPVEFFWGLIPDEGLLTSWPESLAPTRNEFRFALLSLVFMLSLLWV